MAAAVRAAGVSVAGAAWGAEGSVEEVTFAAEAAGMAKLRVVAAGPGHKWRLCPAKP
jgi:hypothetical protein